MTQRKLVLIRASDKVYWTNTTNRLATGLNVFSYCLVSTLSGLFDF